MIARGEDLKNRGRENIVQGATLAAPLILATKSAAEFSSGMVDIQQKAELSDAATDSLANNIVRMSRAAKLMPEEMRSGLDLLLAKGMDLDAATVAIGPAGRLATAYKVDLPDAAGAAYSSIKNLKVASAETARVFDIMAAAGNEGGFEVADMARHFPSLTAQMQALGEKGTPAVADLSAALQVAMHTAGNADEAGNNIKNLLAKINAPATIRAFKKNFGVDLPAAMQRLQEQGYGSLEAIALLTKQATGGDMKRLGFAFEDMQARQGIMALIQNMDEYRRIRAAATDSEGTVDRGFDQRATRDAMVNWEAFKSSASQLAITLGTTLLPVASEAMTMIGGLASSVSEWAQANPRAAATLTKIVAGLAVFKIGLGVAQFALGGLLGPLANVIAVTRKLGGAARLFGIFRTAALFMARGVMQAGLMMMANPVVLAITLIVAAIALAGYMIYKHWDTIKAAFWKGVAAVGQALGWVRDRLVAGFAYWASLHVRALQIGKQIVAGLARGIMAAPGAVWNALKHVVMGGIGRVKDWLGIKSPSRVFMAIGQHSAEGMALGIERRGRRAVGAAGRLARGVAGAAALGLTPVAASAGGQAADGRASPVSAAAAAAPAKIEIHIHQLPGQDAKALAQEVRRELEQFDAIKRRRDYQDPD
ncbi:phage tail tape measure protein [Pelagerythrobacter sp.]|uniref:phage tail tape measure protein n=1 Tax=Pelagerythrobacter sp. TaxID=2800702 RepID=UPI0035AF0A04